MRVSIPKAYFGASTEAWFDAFMPLDSGVSIPSKVVSIPQAFEWIIWLAIVKVSIPVPKVSIPLTKNDVPRVEISCRFGYPSVNEYGL